MLEANFISGYETVTVQGLTQWDKGQKLKITGLASLPATFQVHFANTTIAEAIVMLGSATGGVGTVDIPNSLLEDGLDIRAWIYVTDAEGSETIKTILMPVAERTKPADFISEPNPTEQTLLEQTLSGVNTTMGMLGDPNGIATLDNLGKVNTSQLPSYVDDVVEGYYSGGKFYKESAHTTLITGETGKVYLDISVSPANSYRYSGSAYVKINNVGDSAANTTTFSEASTLANIVSGETHATMFGKIKKLFTDIANLHSQLAPLIFAGAAAHNAIYRGKSLGSAVTAAQYAAISDGTFEDLYIGDYWTIGGVNYRIAAFDYYLNCGDTATPSHHAVIVPDTCLYNAVMNTSDTTAGGYVGSQMYTANLAQAKTTIKGTFSGHVMNHRIYLVNAVANGYSSGGAWVDSEVDLMNEQMVYGCGIFSPVSTGSTVPVNHRVEKSQLPLFAHDPSRICNRNNWWLRDVITAPYFAIVYDAGSADYGGSSYPRGVRPAFCIS